MPYMVARKSELLRFKKLRRPTKAETVRAGWSRPVRSGAECSHLSKYRRESRDYAVHGYRISVLVVLDVSVV